MSEKINAEIEKHVRNNTTWSNLPVHIKQVLKHCPDEYNRYVYNYSLRNQLRHKGNLVRKIFKNEERYYELLTEKSINNLCLFPYHLADIVTKGLRVTPFNYYIEVMCNFLKNEKSYDTLPNFTAADCLRVLGIGRNEYLSLASQLKTNSSKIFRRPNPKHILPKFPVKIHIEPWWKIEIGYVLESDIKYVNEFEKNLIDDLIDSGPQLVGECDYNVIHGLYRKGLIYLDVPINGEDKICIPPLRNFVMNRLSGDYFENLLYKIFVSADEHMSICELSKVLQIDLETVQHAVSLICRLGFAKKISCDSIKNINLHESWKNRTDNDIPTCSLNYNALLMHSNNSTSSSSNENGGGGGDGDGAGSLTKTNKQKSQQKQQQTSPKQQIKLLDNSIEYISSDGNASDFSFTALPISSDLELNQKINNYGENSENDFSSEIEDITGEMKNSTINSVLTITNKPSTIIMKPTTSPKSGKRIGFLFDSTLTAFLMMGNLSPGLKNHAVTMFEVGKLCEESMDTFLAELEKVSLLDAEGEGEVSRYFAHAVILRSTIIALRSAFENGLDLLRLECLESLDYKTRDRLLEKKYKFIISASPLTGFLSYPFTIPFFGQFYRSSNTSHIWSKFFYYHISGYGPPSLFLCKGTILKTLPRLFLGYGKLLVTIVHTDSYVLSSENYHNINEQLKNDCVLVQGYGVRNIGKIKYESFPFDKNDPTKVQLLKHKAIKKLKEHLDLNVNCGYITFVNTGVPDIGCENYDFNVRLTRSKTKRKKSLPNNLITNDNNEHSNSHHHHHHNYNNLNYLNDNDDDNLNVQIETSHSTVPSTPIISDLYSPMDNSEVTSFNRSKAKSMIISTSSSSSITPGAIILAASTAGLTTTSTDEITSKISLSPTMMTTSTSTSSKLTIDHLKTPDENYFAITPQNSSPSNIYRSEDCNEILATVLDNLANQQIQQNQHEINSINDDEDTINVSKSIKNLDKCDDSFNNSCNNGGEIWTLLDVHFGVPLFDADCNTRICEHIVKNLSSEENLQKLSSSHVAMNDKFLKFVKQCLYFEDEYNDIIKIGRLLPQPRINLAFENGKVCYWNGK